MESIELSVVAAAFLVLCGALVAARLQIAGERDKYPPGSRAKLPRVAVIVPVTGAAPGMRECLDTIASQDYPDYQVFFVTESAEDAAVQLVLDTIAAARSGPTCRHVVSGQARTCGQKNHNILAGIAEAGPDREVFVFCDSSHLAPPDYLESLVQPIASGHASVATGYHHALPEDMRFATYGRAMSVLLLCILQEIPPLRQPWGGSTAITRKAFEELNVAEVWAVNVVDDVSLAMILKKSAVPVACVPGAMLSTPVRGETVSGWSDWFTRQWLYLKFCFRGSWIAAGVALYLTAVLALWEITRVVLTIAGYLPFKALLLPLFFLFATAVASNMATRLHPRPGRKSRWLAALYANIFLATWCHLRTLLTEEIRWRGKTYVVGPHGRIVHIRR